MYYAVCDRDVTDDLNKFLTLRGKEALADDLYQQEVITWASSDGEAVFVSTECNLDPKLLEQFEDYLASNWPTPQEAGEACWKEGSDR